MKRIAYDHIIAFAEAVLAKAGVEPYSANAVAAGLGETSLRGVDSHGVRLLPHYVRSVESGRKVLDEFSRIETESVAGYEEALKHLEAHDKPV